MPRTLSEIDEHDLERELLRQGVGRLAAGRSRCADCGRSPLTGEQLHVYATAQVVCELCRPLRAAPPERSEPVRGGEHGHTVRVRRLAA